MIHRVRGDLAHWSTTAGHRPSAHFGIHRHGQCWKLFSLPKVTRYRGGEIIWFSWWRLFLAVEKFTGSHATSG